MPSKKTTSKAAAPKKKRAKETAAAKPKAGAPAWVNRIARKVDSAKLLTKSKAKIFRPTLDEAKITAFEKQLGLPVPKEYRDYLLYLGGGGYGPYNGIVPLQVGKAENDVKAIVVSVLDHNEPILLVAEGTQTGKVVGFDEDEEKWFTLGTFPEFFEQWIDDELLHDAVDHAIQSSLETRKQLKPELHALVLEFATIFDRPVLPGSRWEARIPNATLALYLGDRAKAERVCAELVAIEQDEEKIELGGGTYSLVNALWPNDVENSRSKDPAIFEPLSKHPSAAVRRFVVWQERLSPASLANMAEDPSDEVRGFVARHPNATAEILARVFEFSKQRWNELGPSTQRLFALTGAARNPNASPAHAEEICKVHASSKEPHAPWLVRDALLHPKLSAPTLSALAKHSHPAIRQGVASHPSLSMTDLEALAKDADESVRAAIGFRSDTPPEILTQLTRDDFESVVIVAIWNKRTPHPALVRLVAEGRSDLLVALAQRENLDKKAADHVKKHPWYREPQTYDFPFTPTIMPDGKQCIACRSFRNNPTGGHHRYFASASSFEAWDEGAYAHPAFPVPILPAYVDEHYGNGGREMCLHPWLDDALMTRLATPKEPMELHSSTLSAIALHPRLLPALREKLLEGYGESIARNPVALPAILEMLATSPAADVRAAVAGHRRTPTSTLISLAKDSELTVRRSIAANSSTPPSVVDALVKDENEHVRSVAEWNMKARALA